MAEQWMSIIEYARTFAISDMTVRRRIKNGKLKAILKDGKYYIPLSSEQATLRTQLGGKPSHFPHELPSQAKPSHFAHETVPATKPNPHYGHDVPPPPHRTEVAKPRPGEEMMLIKGGGRPAQFPTEPHNPALGHSSWSRQPVPSPHMRDDPSPVPNTIRTTLSGSEASLVNTQALLAFCESAIQKVESSEKQIAEKFESKVRELQAELKAKDAEIKNLCQQVEDLQLLVKIFEKKPHVSK